jgi:hypothetical protein
MNGAGAYHPRWQVTRENHFARYGGERAFLSENHVEQGQGMRD